MTVNRAARADRRAGAHAHARLRHVRRVAEVRIDARRDPQHPDEVAARGHGYRAQVLQVGAAVADAKLADELQIDTGSPIFHSRVLHFENDTPVQLEERWVNPACAPEYALQDFTTTTPNQYLTRVAPLQRVEYRIEAAMPDAETCRHLTMDDREPCLLLHRRTWSQEWSRRSPIQAPGQPVPVHRAFLS